MKAPRVLFLDIDGVVLPERANFLPNQTRPIHTTFDPCSVALLNKICHLRRLKLVLHSSWIRTIHWNMVGDGDVVAHCIKQGIKKGHFHPDPYCDRDISYRYDRVSEWLSRHDVKDFRILDDCPCEPDYKYKDHLILTDPNEGITVKIFETLTNRW